MPEIVVNVGGRPFTVACQEGQEGFLNAAADLLNSQSVALIDQIGQLPEGRMLLMSGLMLADKTLAAEEELRQAQAELAELKSRQGGVAPNLDDLAALVDRAEALAVGS